MSQEGGPLAAGGASSSRSEASKLGEARGDESEGGGASAGADGGRGPAGVVVTGLGGAT